MYPHKMIKSTILEQSNDEVIKVQIHQDRVVKKLFQRYEAEKAPTYLPVSFVPISLFLFFP